MDLRCPAGHPTGPGQTACPLCGSVLVPAERVGYQAPPTTRAAGPALSPDGRHWWDGSTWVAVAQPAPPPPPYVGQPHVGQPRSSLPALQVVAVGAAALAGVGLFALTASRASLPGLATTSAASQEDPAGLPPTGCADAPTAYPFDGCTRDAVVAHYCEQDVDTLPEETSFRGVDAAGREVGSPVYAYDVVPDPTGGAVAGGVLQRVRHSLNEGGGRLIVVCQDGALAAGSATYAFLPDDVRRMTTAGGSWPVEDSTGRPAPRSTGPQRESSPAEPVAPAPAAEPPPEPTLALGDHFGYSNADLGGYASSASSELGCPLYSFGIAQSGETHLDESLGWYSVRYPGLTVVFLPASDIDLADYPQRLTTRLPGTVHAPGSEDGLAYLDGDCAITFSGTPSLDQQRELLDTGLVVPTSTSSAVRCEEQLFEVFGRWGRKELSEAEAVSAAGPDGAAMQSAIDAAQAEDYIPAGQPPIYEYCAGRS